MLICQHIIKSSEIVGIGPLMRETATDQISAQVYDSVRYFFMLHLKNQSVRIESNLVARAGMSEPQLHRNKIHLKEFESDYDFAVTTIKTLVNDEQPAHHN